MLGVTQTQRVENHASATPPSRGKGCGPYGGAATIDISSLEDSRVGGAMGPRRRRLLRRRPVTCPVSSVFAAFPPPAFGFPTQERWRAFMGGGIGKTPEARQPPPPVMATEEAGPIGLRRVRQTTHWHSRRDLDWLW